jgi:glycine/D-amino acid oxidase-like deaminating enzyme
MSASCIAVVGAGIIGCAVVREIRSRAPEASISLLDQDIVATGASRRSAGLHLPRGATPRVRSMTLHSHDFYDALRTARPSLPIRPLDMDVVASATSEEEVREVYLERAGLTRAEGVSEPFVRLPEKANVWQGTGCLHADVTRVAQSFIRGLRPPVKLHEGLRVTGVEPVREGVALRTGTGHVLTADRVVLAPGPWLATPAWHDLVAPLGVRVKKVVALHILRPPAEHSRAVVFHDEDAFLLPLHDQGQWLFSFTRQDWDVTPDSVGGGLDTDDLREGLETLRRYAPGLAGEHIAGRVFCDAYSPTGEPLVVPLADTRIVFAGAANGSGFRLAPAIAAEAADLMRLPSAVPVGAGPAARTGRAADEPPDALSERLRGLT